MDVQHRLTIEDDNGDDVLFACAEPGCGRRLIVKRSGGLVVLQRGDVQAMHSGGSRGLSMSATLGD